MGTQGGFDVAFDNIKSILEIYSAAQPEEEQFILKADYYRNYTSLPAGAHVFLYLGPIIPDPRSSARNVHFAYDVDYVLDLIALGKGTQGAEYTRADEAAGIRFRYLVQQILNALYQPDKPNLGLPQGTLSKKPMLRIDPLPPEMQIGERPIVGARLILTLGMAWEPGVLAGDALTDINVTADKWSALFKP